MLIAVMLRHIFRRYPSFRWFRAWLLFFPVLGALMVLSAYAAVELGGGGSAPTGLAIFRTIGAMVLVGLCAAAPFIGSAQMVQDRRTRVLALLLITDAGPVQILAGKLLGALILAGLTILGAMPLMLLGVSLGGIEAAQVLQAGAIFAACLAVAVTLGLLVAVLVSNPRRLMLALGLATATFFGLLPMSLSRLGDDWMVAGSPFLAFLKITENRLAPGLFAAHVGAMVLLSLLFFTLSCALCRRQALRGEGPVAGRRPRAAASQRPAQTCAGGNPVGWRDETFVYGGWLWRQLLWVLLLVGAVVAGSFWANVWPRRDPEAWLAMTGGVMAVGGLLIHAANYVMDASRLWSAEVDQGTLPLLLVSELTAGDIVSGKIRALGRAHWPSAAVAVVGALFWVLVGRVWFGLIALLILAAMWYALSGIAVYTALRMVRRGQVLVYVVLALVLILSPAILAVVGVFGVLVFGGLGPLAIIAAPLAVGSLCRQATAQNLRAVAAGEI